MSTDDLFEKESLEKAIEELSSEYKKISSNEKISKIILVGGAAVLLNYNFRKTTGDIDASIYSSKEMLSAINNVALKNKFPNDWINTDFENSSSYSENLEKVSKYYKTFSNKIEVRSIEGEYLIAMKLTSGRDYKHDLSDIAGILMEHKNRGKEIKLKDVDKAVKYLYGNWNKISNESKMLINEIFENGDYEKIFKEKKKNEEKTRENTLRFGNANNFIEMLKGEKDNENIIKEMINERNKKKY
jgi:hypothetical protein